MHLLNHILVMEYPDYLRELMRELSPSEFLHITLKKLDEIKIETEEQLLLLDKVLYKVSNLSKDIKMRMLTPQLQAKFLKFMDDMKLDKTNFMNMLKPYEQGKGPYSRMITSNTPSASNTTENLEASRPADRSDNASSRPVVADNAQMSFQKTASSSDRASVVSSTDKNSRLSYGGSARSAERGGMTPKRTRSSSSSSGSSSSDSEARSDFRGKLNKLQDDIFRFTNQDASSAREGGSEKKSGRPPQKYSFSMKKTDASSSGRVVRAHGVATSSSKDDSYFERSSRAFEPRSERGEVSSSSRGERDYGRSPDVTDLNSPGRSDNSYNRSQGKWVEKKSYRPSRPYKH